MTHGEQYVMMKDSMRLENGKFKVDDSFTQSIRPMPKHKAIEYYNEKLRNYWLENLDESIPKRFRSIAINFLLGRAS